MFMILFMFALVYATTGVLGNKVPQLQMSTKKRLLVSGVSAVFWPVTIGLGVVLGAGVYYHNNVKALPFVNSKLLIKDKE